VYIQGETKKVQHGAPKEFERMAPMPTPDQTPQPDNVSAKVDPAVHAAVPLTATSSLVKNAVTQMHTVGGGQYTAVLSQLRQSAGDTVATTQRLYTAAPVTSYMERWSLVKVMVDLQHPAALPSLNAIVHTPMPVVQGEDAPVVLAEETMIRTTAAEEIGRQAASGEAAALPLLLQNCQSPIFSVKQASVQAYLATGGPNARATVDKVLPADQKFVLDIKPLSASQMQQPAPGAARTKAAKAAVATTPAIQGAAGSVAASADAPTHKTA
jgi:hypothetical protein